jgi:hypothetical protein
VRKKDVLKKAVGGLGLYHGGVKLKESLANVLMGGLKFKELAQV